MTFLINYQIISKKVAKMAVYRKFVYCVKLHYFNDISKFLKRIIYLKTKRVKNKTEKSYRIAHNSYFEGDKYNSEKSRKAILNRRED